MQTAGYSILHASKDGHSLTGEQYAFGEGAVPFRLTR
jgi:hypothetical protein